jgi:trigger factor
MPYTLTRKPNHTVEITAQLAAEAVEAEQRHVVQVIRRRAQVPGFRPGKAPENAVRARYADEIRSELEEHLVQALWREVVDGEERLEPLTQPQVDRAELDSDGSFHLAATLEVRPHFELPSTDGVELPDSPLEPTDDEIAAELQTVRDEQASWEPVEDDTVAEDGLLVEADLEGQMEDSDDEPYHEENAHFVLGTDGVPPEVNEALQGAVAGDVRTAEKRFPDDDPKPDRAGKKVTYSMTVKALKRKVLPELDDGIAAALGLDTLDELRDRIREMLNRRKRAQRREDWRRAILDHLATDIDANDLPSSLVQGAVREDLNRFAYSMAMQGMAPDSDQVNWQELAARAEPAARRRVLDNLILEQLADEWEIQTPESEVDAYITGEARQQGLPPAEHKANLAREDRLDQIRHAARVSATVDELIRRAGGEVD